MTNNGLKLNADKTKCMLIHTPRARVDPPPLIWLWNWASVQFQRSQCSCKGHFDLVRSHQPCCYQCEPPQASFLVSSTFAPGPLPHVLHSAFGWLLWCRWDNCNQHNSSCLGLHRLRLFSSSALVGCFILLSWPINVINHSILSRTTYSYIDSHNDIWTFNYTCYVYILNCLLLFFFFSLFLCLVLYCFWVPGIVATG